MTYCNYVQFSELVSSISFSKKQFLYLRWVFAGLLWYLTEDLNLLGLFDRNAGLTTKCAMMKVSENVVEESLSETQVDMTNTKNKTFVECELQARSLVEASLPLLSHCFSLRPNFPC